jgi:hypothetical protein
VELRAGIDALLADSAAGASAEEQADLETLRESPTEGDLEAMLLVAERVVRRRRILRQ